MSEEQIKQYYKRIEKILNGANKGTYGFAPEEIRQILKLYDYLQQENKQLKEQLEQKLTPDELYNMLNQELVRLNEQLQQDNKLLKKQLGITKENYTILSADIGTVAEYMKLDKDAIIEEMITRSVELVNKEHIIDELEKWLMDENNQKYSKDIWNYSVNSWVLTKLQELKGSDKE